MRTTTEDKLRCEDFVLTAEDEKPLVFFLSFSLPCFLKKKEDFFYASHFLCLL